MYDINKIACGSCIHRHICKNIEAYFDAVQAIDSVKLNGKEVRSSDFLDVDVICRYFRENEPELKKNIDPFSKKAKEAIRILTDFNIKEKLNGYID